MTRALVGFAVALGLVVVGAQLAHYEDRERAEYHVARADLAVDAAETYGEGQRVLRAQLLAEIAAREAAERALREALAACRPLERRR